MPFMIFSAGSMAFLSYSLFWYKRQKHQNTIGGMITLPKFIWLVLCMYTYYFLTPMIYYTCSHTFLCNALLAMIIYLIARAAIQGFMMYFSGNWSAKGGILFNIGGILIASFFMIEDALHWWALFKSSVPVALLLFHLVLMFSTDAYYAYRFHTLVGNGTKGDRAIWFAGHDHKFDRINKITTYLNLVHLTLFLYLLINWLTIK